MADTENKRIQKFDANGNFITTWVVDEERRYPTKDVVVINPVETEDIAVDSSGYVYVVVRGIRFNIQKFDSDSNFITAWGSPGTGDGEFFSPMCIAVDSSGYVYVADTYNHRIQEFDSDGNFITKWGSRGTVDGEFQYPHGA